MTDPGRPTSGLRWLTGGLFVPGAGFALNSLLGPLALDVIRCHHSTPLLNQGIGLDAVAVFSAVPVSVAAGVLVLRGHRPGPVPAFIPAAFAACPAPQYAVGPDYLGLPGNNERFFLFHLGLFVLGAALLVGARQAVDRGRLLPDTRRSDRRRSVVLLAVAAFSAAAVVFTLGAALLYRPLFPASRRVAQGGKGLTS